MVPLRYVVLHHVGIARPHFDLMFEADVGAALTTLRCPRWPLEAGDVCDELPDHRRTYLDYEGPISGDRGSVCRVESGTIEVRDLSIDPPTFGLVLNPATPSPATELTLIHEFILADATSVWRVNTVRQISK